jgi:thioredoxin-dependent peroxiredoxin
MIGDEKGEIARRFDVVWPLMKLTMRVTFLIDGQGIIRGVFHHEVRIGKHVDDVVFAVRRMKSTAAEPLAGTPQKV